jgi:hypothetical protein
VRGDPPCVQVVGQAEKVGAARGLDTAKPGAQTDIPVVIFKALRSIIPRRRYFVSRNIITASQGSRIVRRHLLRRVAPGSMLTLAQVAAQQPRASPSA